MIETTKGPMDEAHLRRVDGVDTTERAETRWVEYYLADELVHRSAHVQLK